MFKAIPLWLRLGFLLVVVASALLLWWMPKMRTSAALEKAEAAIEARAFEEAGSTLRTLLARYPRNTAVALRLAEVLRTYDATSAFQLFRELHEAGRLPLELYPDAILLGFEIGNLEEANVLYAHVEETAPNLPRLIGLQSVRAMMEGDLATSRSLLEESLALFPEWHSLRYIEGQLLRRSPSKIDQLRAKEDLRTVAESDSFAAVQALFALVGADNLALSAEEKHAFLGRVLRHPWASPQVRLLAHHYRWQLDPERRAAEVEDAMADLGASEPVLLAEWMNAIGEYKRALELVPDGVESTTDAPAFEQRFRALAMGGQFEEAEALVRSSQIGENAVQQAARLFLVSLRPDNSDEAVERWNEAFALARQEEDLGVQYFLGRSALRLGYIVGAIQAYQGLFADEGFAAAAAESVWMEYFTVTLATGDMEGAHDVLVDASARFPESVALVNNRLYIELIAEMDWAETYQQFMALAPPPADITDINGTGSTWVLSTLFNDQPAEALRILEVIEAGNPDQAINDSTKIVKALVLSANDQLTEAVRLSEEIDRDKVLPAEWALLGNLRLDP